MELIDDMMSGKYNTILIGILFVFVFHQYWNKTCENMADTSSITSDQLQEAIRKQYNVDVEAIRNLSNVATQLQAGGLTIPGDLTIRGNLTTQGELRAESGKILMGTVGSNLWGINVNQDDNGTFALGRVGRDGNPSDKVGLKLISSADGSQFVGGSLSLVPVGTIVAWTGEKAPDGWALCDGQNKTPDLRGRFIIGTGKGENLSERKINDIGGLESVTLTVDNIPPHSHVYTKTTAGSSGTEGSKNDRAKPPSYTDTNTSTVGGGKPHENMPPFYALAYIMKL